MDNRTEVSRGWSIALGIGLVVLGLATIALSAFTTFFAIWLLGVVLVIRGIIDMVTSFSAVNREKGFWWHLFGGILSLIVGALILARPGVTAVAVTFLVGAFFVAIGIFKTVAAPVEHTAHWGWVMLSGIISLLVGIWILGAMPGIAIWLIGLLVGIEITVQGFVMMFYPYAVRQQRGAGEMYAR